MDGTEHDGYDLSLVTTVRIAANDKHMFSALAAHVTRRPGLSGSRRFGIVQCSPVEAR